MKLSLSTLCLLVLCFGCNGTTTIDISEENGRVELSDEVKEEIEDVIREVLREELANMNQPGGTSLSQALKEAKGKNDQALVEEKKKNADDLVMTCLRIASDAQAWLRKPAAFGGAVSPHRNRPTNFEGLTLSFEQLGYPIDSNNIYTDIHGSYEIEVQEDEVLTITARNESLNNLISVEVAGPLTQDINTQVQHLQ